jgi:hypothetical protein
MKLRAGDRVRLDGWLVELVSDGGVLAIHADDLAADAPSFKPGVDAGLPWIANQSDVAESYGLAFTPIDARLATLEVCPEAHEGFDMASLLARSETAALAAERTLAAAGYERIGGIHKSGWYIGCSQPDCRGRGLAAVAHHPRSRAPAQTSRSRPVPRTALGRSRRGAQRR